MSTFPACYAYFLDTLGRKLVPPLQNGTLQNARTDHAVSGKKKKYSKTVNRCHGSGSGYRRAKMPPQNRRKSINLIFKDFRSAGYSFLRAKGFSYSLDVLKRGLGISKLQCLIKK
jgi:hypothetical protein